MTRDSKLWVIANVIYWVVTVAWFISIMFVVNLYHWERNSGIDSQNRINEIIRTPIEEYFLYEEVHSSKEIFALWEPIKMLSTRELFRNDLGIGWNDILFCDTFDGLWYSWTSSLKWSSKKPEIGRAIEKPRVYSGILPQNPVGNYIPADCYMRSVIEICEQDICKQQEVRSNDFQIRWV